MPLDSKKLLADLCAAHGPSGFEDEVVELAKTYIADATTEENNIRNLYIYPNINKGDRPVVMLDGHSDELGFIVQSIRPNGAINFLPLGGWVPGVVLGGLVRVRNSEGKYINGVIGAKPPHFMTEAERGKQLSISDMIIDIGATSKKEVEEHYKIELGAPVVPHVPTEVREDTGVILTKSLDNRLGCAAVIDTLDRVRGKELAVDVVGSLSSQEETGGRGIRSSVTRNKPDIIIVFEGTPSDDIFVPDAYAQGQMGKGAQIRHFDRSMIANPRLMKFAKDLAKKHGIKIQEAVRSGGGTNAGHAHVMELGIPCIVIGAPVRYAHSYQCISSLEDYESCVQLALAIIEEITPEIIASL